MSVAQEAEGMVKYQFEIDDDTWERWKNTVPRTKSLEERIIELIEADTEGRVGERSQPPSTSAATEPEPTREEPEREERESTEEDALQGLSFPSGVSHDDGVGAILAARDYLQEHGSASMRQIVLEVMPEHPLKYDPPESLETGDRYRGAWWRSVVKPGLEALDAVEKPGRGGSKWKYVGGDDE